MKESLPVVGSKVRYPRTGTAGTIEAIEIINGSRFGKIDSTGLWYRLDQLISIESLRTHAPRKKGSVDDFRNEKKLTSEEISEGFDSVTGVGAG